MGHEGDGSLGILEGYASGIRWDGTQLRRLPLRSDCNAESAMVLVFRCTIIWESIIVIIREKRAEVIEIIWELISPKIV